MTPSRPNRRRLRRVTAEDYTRNLYKKGRETVTRIEEAADAPTVEERQTFTAPNGQTMTLETEGGHLWFTTPKGTFRFEDREMALQFVDVLESAWDKLPDDPA